MVKRLPSTHSADEVFERVLNGGLALDAVSYLVALSARRDEQLLAAPYCPLTYEHGA